MSQDRARPSGFTASLRAAVGKTAGPRDSDPGSMLRFLTSLRTARVNGHPGSKRHHKHARPSEPVGNTARALTSVRRSAASRQLGRAPGKPRP